MAATLSDLENWARDALDLLQLLHELLGVDGLAAQVAGAGGVGIGLAVLVLDAVAAVTFSVASTSFRTPAMALHRAGWHQEDMRR